MEERQKGHSRQRKPSEKLQEMEWLPSTEARECKWSVFKFIYGTLVTV